MYEGHVLRVFDDAELATHPITDEVLQAIQATEEGPDELVTFSRQLHYLLSLITARLVVRENMRLNRLES